MGKVAFVSGGARGLEASHSRRFVAEGGRVIIGDILDEQGEALVREVGDAARFVQLAPQPERPVRQCPPRFVAGGHREAQAALHSCGQKKRPPCTSGRLSCLSSPK
jgi:NAD(P)-dependent dehydrogenase (short-subunit alcohol dehydrogenase family)